MEQIDLQEILNKNIEKSEYSLPIYRDQSIIDAMKEVWNLAVDKCIEVGKAKDETYWDENMKIAHNCIINKESLEQVKQII